jgi:hypothetical protein
MADPKDNLNKDTVYIDIDDEITSIIEKVRASQAKIVALVLPKRATVLQSIVNMKLLKRTAESAKKSLVLITTEAGLLPLAGTVGLYVAKNLQTKPVIPVVDGADSDAVDDLSEPEEVDFDPTSAADKSVGDLAISSSVPLVGAAAVAKGSDAIETLELDDDGSSDAGAAGSAAAAGAAAGAKAAKPKKPKKDKKLAVPNFESFRKKLFLIIPIGLLLLVGLFLLLSALPKAEVVIKTDTSDVNSNLAITIDTGLKAADLEKQAIPAQLQKIDKSGSQQVTATGKKNNGNKASGNVTVTNCDSDDVTIPAGTGFTSSGNTYISTKSVTVPVSNFTSPGTGSKCKNDGKASVPVTAQAGGANYNLGNGASFKIVGYSLLSGVGDDITGGTDNIVQVVSQSDIDSATQKITAQNADSVNKQLQDQLKQAHYYPLPVTFTAGTPNITSSSKPGDEASTVTVSQTTTYTMFGVQEKDLKALVDNDVKDKIDPKKQSILSEGLDKATYKVNSASPTGAQLSVSTIATAGPDLKADDLKKQLAGMKKGEIRDTLLQNPGVKDVDVHLSPFWVTSVPKKADKVTITFQKAN